MERRIPPLYIDAKMRRNEATRAVVDAFEVKAWRNEHGKITGDEEHTWGNSPAVGRGRRGEGGLKGTGVRMEGWLEAPRGRFLQEKGWGSEEEGTVAVVLGTHCRARVA